MPTWERLRGAPIARHEQTYGLRFNPYPPYTILRTDDLDSATLQRLGRFARYWELVGNSGRFRRGRALLLGDFPFARFLMFSDWLFATTGQTHQISQDRLFDLVYQWLIGEGGLDRDTVAAVLAEDFESSGIRSVPKFMEADKTLLKPHPSKLNRGAGRQERHLV